MDIRQVRRSSRRKEGSSLDRSIWEFKALSSSSFFFQIFQCTKKQPTHPTVLIPFISTEMSHGSSYLVKVLPSVVLDSRSLKVII